MPQTSDFQNLLCDTTVGGQLPFANAAEVEDFMPKESGPLYVKTPGFG